MTTVCPSSCKDKDATDCTAGEPSFGSDAVPLAVAVVVATGSNSLLFRLARLSFTASSCILFDDPLRDSGFRLLASPAVDERRPSELFSRLRFAASSRSSLDGCRESLCGSDNDETRFPFVVDATESVILESRLVFLKC